MKKLPAYILKNTLKSLIPAFIALVSLMVIGVCMQLLHDGLDVVRLSSLLPLLLAYCVPMVLPAAFLTAVIMTFGRLSADNELIAVRAAGIPLFSVIHPVLTAGLVLSLVVAYFQFETVPRARGAIRALRSQALKQILLDKVALSWRRQFAFPPAYVEYADFRDGKMLDVVVLEVQQDRPRMVITAASATVRGDAEQPDTVLFELNDCVVTHFDVQESAEPRTIASQTVRYFVRVAPKIEDVLASPHYLTLIPLLKDMQQLRLKMANQPRFPDPDQARKEALAKRQKLDAWLAELTKTLAANDSKLLKYSVQEPSRQQQVIARSKKSIEEKESRLRELQQQQADCVKRLDDMQGASADLEALVQLQKLQRDLLAQVDRTGKELVSLRAELAAAQKALTDASARAVDYRAQVAELQQRKEALQSQRDDVTKIVWLATGQSDMDSASIWIHKRLAQGLSVLAFALVGIPLGMLPSRRSFMVAFGMSFGVVLLIFYPFLILGEIAAQAGTVPIVPAIWAGDAVTFGIGAVLMVWVLRR